MPSNEYYLPFPRLEAIAKLVMSPVAPPETDWHAIAEMLIQHIASCPQEKTNASSKEA